MNKSAKGQNCALLKSGPAGESKLETSNDDLSGLFISVLKCSRIIPQFMEALQTL